MSGRVQSQHHHHGRHHRGYHTLPTEDDNHQQLQEHDTVQADQKRTIAKGSKCSDSRKYFGDRWLGLSFITFGASLVGMVLSNGTSENKHDSD